MLHYERLQFYLRLRLKLKKIHHVLEFSQSQWLKPYIEFNKQKIKAETEAEKNGNKDEKALFKLMNNAVYEKTVENLRNRIHIKLVNNKTDYSKCTLKTIYM